MRKKGSPTLQTLQDPSAAVLRLSKPKLWPSGGSRASAITRSSCSARHASSSSCVAARVTEAVSSWLQSAGQHDACSSCVMAAAAEERTAAAAAVAESGNVSDLSRQRGERDVSEVRETSAR